MTATKEQTLLETLEGIYGKSFTEGRLPDHVWRDTPCEGACLLVEIRDDLVLIEVEYGTLTVKVVARPQDALAAVTTATEATRTFITAGGGAP